MDCIIGIYRSLEIAQFFKFKTVNSGTESALFPTGLIMRLSSVHMVGYEPRSLMVDWVKGLTLLLDLLASSSCCFLLYLSCSARCSGLRLDSLTLKKSSSLDLSLPLIMLVLMFVVYSCIDLKGPLLWVICS